MGFLLKEQKNTNGIIIENLYHDSKSLAKTSYNYDTNQLTATFQKGSVYRYHNVPVSTYEEFKSAPSAGSYFQKNIARGFTYKDLGDVTPTFVAEELASKLPKVDVDEN